MSLVHDWAQALDTSALGVGVAESIYAFPLIEAAHLLGLALSVGLLILIDLRLLGLTLRQVAVTDVLRQLRPWVLTGFAITFISGFLLFSADASHLVHNPAFLAKLVFIALASVNALVFESRVAPKAEEWANALRLPTAARNAGLASIGLWGLVVLTGRLIPYVG